MTKTRSSITNRSRPRSPNSADVPLGLDESMSGQGPSKLDAWLCHSFQANRPPHRVPDDIRRLTYEVTYRQAEIAHYRAKYQAAKRFHIEIEYALGARAQIADTLANAIQRLQSCHREVDQACATLRQDPHGCLDQSLIGMDDVLRACKKGLSQVHAGWNQIEHNCQRFMADISTLDRQYLQDLDIEATEWV